MSFLVFSEFELVDSVFDSHDNVQQIFVVCRGQIRLRMVEQDRVPCQGDRLCIMNLLSQCRIKFACDCVPYPLGQGAFKH